ncbi:hypothetical protein LEP1GSC127_4121 [Leptospira kirschneri str. 200801925]|uniref:Uncharacterized protein n=1 Tax=Leptospira kirschneri str. 200802841 TaxID=1193047 RepID=A0A828Y6Q2_9LEPT|nr:hypothetical protein LEP1GSC131_0857 [Leptospira kirschneri str. 200802841]EKO61495.1 hypothetical protein LEP1GSC082_4001 [Leptospira kirschneri str. H2]EMJ96435.1 hypothetical protein LEP1GSC198_1697 [Leptospira kirschneri str. JB]EMO75063.1 hypothetical protein LEP1GSC127_4121 [Leptospira kirschneri str. 200801925]
MSSTQGTHNSEKSWNLNFIDRVETTAKFRLEKYGLKS